MAVSDIQKETFLQLLEQIRLQVTTLKKQNKELNKENLKLKTELDKIRKGQNDIFSNISESERITMRHQVTNLIEKIDKHLGAKQ